MKTLLKNISKVVTFNNNNDLLENVDILIDNNEIISIKNSIVATEDMKLVDCSNLIALPGFVNTHHHLYQSRLG